LTFKEKKSGSGKIFLIVILISIIGSAAYLYFSPIFEQNKPKIYVKDDIYWNLKTNLKINLEDESGIKYYKIIFQDGGKDIVLNQRVFNEFNKQITIDVNPPRLDIFYKGENSKLIIEAVDNSKWNFLEGNKVVKEVSINIDTKKPIASVLSNSRYIQRGGSAAVVVNVEDKNLKDAYIIFNNEKRFELIPYGKENFYAALIAWPIDFEEFNRVNLVAVDKADNITISKIPLYIQKKRIKTDRINLTKRFIQNVSANVLEQSFEKVPTKLEEIFIYSNKELRVKNIETIEKVALKALEKDIVSEFNINKFKRLRGSKTVANFAERRLYYLDDEKINEAWHLGIDWASIKKAPIYSSNEGEVIFKDYLGLYGNTIIINHGLGLASLYAHTSYQSVEVGDLIEKNKKIANTGATGAVFGDHLHFGILVQGVEVNPKEWMDSNWIQSRILDILESGKKQISSMK
jgi:murein DD-endopeptidase MepM/ murein hydrolase activator NlpD